MAGAPTLPWSWLEDMPRRTRIEVGARRAYPKIRYRRRQGRLGPIHTYEVELDVPGFEPRRVWVEFWYPNVDVPRIFADGPIGPDGSPHRFDERGWTRLCVWFPSDPAERRWVPDDGLLMLFGMVAEHLFKEAYWRETSVWLGEEAPHSPKGSPDEEAA